MKPRHKRIAAIALGVVALGVATTLVLKALQQELVFFFTPSDIVANKAPQGRTFRIGGMVEEGSVKRDGIEVRFVVTDTAKTIPVVYRGALPDLFREGRIRWRRASTKAPCSSDSRLSISMKPVTGSMS